MVEAQLMAIPPSKYWVEILYIRQTLRTLSQCLNGLCLEH